MDLQYTGGVMEFDRFFKFSQLLLRDEFVLSYSGYVSEDILLAVGDTLRERLEDHARDGAQIRNVFSIFVELMQNIIRYGVEGPQPGPEDGEKPSFGIVKHLDAQDLVVTERHDLRMHGPGIDPCQPAA